MSFLFRKALGFLKLQFAAKHGKMKDGPFGDNIFLEKKRVLRILNSVTVPQDVKGGPFGFFNIHSGADYRNN